VPYVMFFGYSVNLQCFADAFNAQNMMFDQNICLFLKYYYMKWMALGYVASDAMYHILT